MNYLNQLLTENSVVLVSYQAGDCRNFLVRTSELELLLSDRLFVDILQLMSDLFAVDVLIRAASEIGRYVLRTQTTVFCYQCYVK